MWRVIERIPGSTMFTTVLVEGEEAYPRYEIRVSLMPSSGARVAVSLHRQLRANDSFVGPLAIPCEFMPFVLEALSVAQRGSGGPFGEGSVQDNDALADEQRAEAGDGDDFTPHRETPWRGGRP